MFKRFVLIAVLALVAVLGNFAISVPASAEAAVSCDVLYLSATILNSGWTNPVYRVNGTGPGLPTEGIAVPSGEWVDISWEVYGPGTWTGLWLEFTAGELGGSYVTSGYSVTASCSAVGCVANVPIPSTAVVGRMTDNAAVFGMPDPAAMTNTVLEVGKTFWMDGLDASGMYRKLLISCEWVWVEADKTGPNYDEVWNGTPLPGHTVD